LLFLNGTIARDEQPRFTEALGLNTAGIYAHVLHQPRFHRFGASLAQIEIVLVASKGVSMTFDPKNCLRIPLNQSA
jgi:hypothetical protein